MRITGPEHITRIYQEAGDSIDPETAEEMFRTNGWNDYYFYRQKDQQIRLFGRESERVGYSSQATPEQVRQMTLCDEASIGSVINACLEAGIYSSEGLVLRVSPEDFNYVLVTVWNQKLPLPQGRHPIEITWTPEYTPPMDWIVGEDDSIARNLGRLSRWVAEMLMAEDPL